VLDADLCFFFMGGELLVGFLVFGGRIWVRSSYLLLPPALPPQPSQPRFTHKTHTNAMCTQRTSRQAANSRSLNTPQVGHTAASGSSVTGRSHTPETTARSQMGGCGGSTGSGSALTFLAAFLPSPPLFFFDDIFVRAFDQATCVDQAHRQLWQD
jgi:hypothetical protein